MLPRRRRSERCSCCVADHHIAGSHEGVPVWDAAVCAAEAAVCGEEPVGGGAAGCRPPEGEKSHHCDFRRTWSNSAGHQAGKSYV